MPSERHTSSFLSHKRFEGLKCLMRHSSSKLQLVAQHLHCTYEGTFKNKAKAKASNKGLCINIERAKGCPQTAVSIMPLPILDTTPSPGPLFITIPPTSDQRRRRRCRRPSMHADLTILTMGQQVLSPLSASVIQIAVLPTSPPDASKDHATLSQLRVASIPSISISYFSTDSAVDGEMESISIATEDDVYEFAPLAPAPILLELPDVPIDADFWDDADMSSSSPSSSGPETPCDSDDGSSFVMYSRKRKSTEEEDEELWLPKHII